MRSRILFSSWCFAVALAIGIYVPLQKQLYEFTRGTTLLGRHASEKAFQSLSLLALFCVLWILAGAGTLLNKKWGWIIGLLLSCLNITLAFYIALLTIIGLIFIFASVPLMIPVAGLMAFVLVILCVNLVFAFKYLPYAFKLISKKQDERRGGDGQLKH